MVEVREEQPHSSAERAARHTEVEWKDVDNCIIEMHIGQGVPLGKVQERLKQTGFDASYRQLYYRKQKCLMRTKTSRALVLAHLKEHGPHGPMWTPAMQKYADREQLWRLFPELGLRTGAHPLAGPRGSGLVEEHLIVDLRQYIMESFGQGTWSFVDNESLIRSSSRSEVDRENLHSFLGNIDLGCKNSTSGASISKESLSHFQAAWKNAENLVGATYHDVVPNVIRQLYDLYNKRFYQTAAALLFHLSRVARTHAHKDSWQRRVFARFHNITLDQLGGLEVAIQALYRDQFDQSLPKPCYSSFVMLKDNAWRRLEQNEQALFSEHLPDIEELDREIGPFTRWPMDVLVVRASVLLSRLQHEEALLELDDLVSRAEFCENTWLRLYFLTLAYFIRAQTALAGNNPSLVIDSLKYFIENEAGFAQQPEGHIFRSTKSEAYGMLEQIAREDLDDEAALAWQSLRTQQAAALIAASPARVGSAAS